jgi:hypothetical protein
MSILRHPQIDPYSTSSFLTTASVASNTITFTKGDGSTFPIAVAAGSNITADNGLTKTGDNVQLGGNLTKLTTIDGQNNLFFLNNTKGIQLGVSNEGLQTKIVLDNNQLDLYTPKIYLGTAIVGQVLTLKDATTGGAEWETAGGGGGGVAFKSTVAGTTVTGTTKTLPTYTLAIPADTFIKGDIIRIHYRVVKKLFDNSSTIKLNIGTDLNIDLSTNIANTFFNAGFPFAQMKRDFIIPSDGKPTNFISAKFTGFSDDNQANELSTLSIDWTETQYLFFAVQNSLASDDATGVSYYIEKL